MTRRFLIVLALWATIYLPALGSLEIKGEEGRRILPAVSMLETGSYVVPQIGSEPYLRKPPLINWLVAASFKLFGVRNEWTARLPSVLCVLSVAIAFVTIAHASLGGMGSLIAAVIWLTNFGLVEKGRLIEIEALYVSLFGLAIICWLTWWQQSRSRWLNWTGPFIFLGLGLLAKGPVHIFFFYTIVFSVLWRSGELRQLWSAPHFLGIAIMFGIFAVWAIPYLEMTQHAHVAHVWSRQFSGRLSGEDFKLGGWLLNIPRSLAYFLPWLVLVPLIRETRFDDSRKNNLMTAISWGIAIPFLVINLLPGSLPRYAMPLLVPAAWLLAMLLTADHVKWPRWLGGNAVPPQQCFRWVTAAALAMVVAVGLYAIAIVPKLQRRHKTKTIAAQIDAIIPDSEPLYAVDPDYQPFLFYLHRPLFYVDRVEDLPRKTRFFLVRPANESAAQNATQFSTQRPQPILHINDYRGWRTILFAIPPH
jgi:4-amino-4-deoxy-L-arabinose transferase-like glycosyltransferase